jgi:hypothetical protein
VNIDKKRKTIYNKAARRRQLNLKSYRTYSAVSLRGKDSINRNNWQSCWPEITTPGGRHNSRWKDNVVVGINEIGYEGKDCINLTEDGMYSELGGESPVYTKGGKY